MKSPLPFLEYYLRPMPGFRLLQSALDAWALRDWERRRVPPAPRAVKVDVLRRQASSVRRTFVETGTFYGDTLELLSGDFEELHSIELSPRLADRARRRFAGRSHIRIHSGDSGLVLAHVLREIARPVVLWLDGHYSGPLTARGETDTPLVGELTAALGWGTPDDVVLIDDARLLGADPAYPTVAEIEARIRSSRTDWTVSLESDILKAGCSPS